MIYNLVSTPGAARQSCRNGGVENKANVFTRLRGAFDHGVAGEFFGKDFGIGNLNTGKLEIFVSAETAVT